MPDCNSGIRISSWADMGQVRGGGGGIPRIWVRDESKFFSNVSQRKVDSINI